jgi:hypothetical protein
VYFVNQTTGWAVGWTGKILKTTNGGSNWLSQSSGTSLDLRSVFVIPDSVTSLDDEPIIDPSNVILLKNYPNPFNPSTIITYSIPNFGKGSLPVKLVVYNLLGEKITTLVNEEKSSGQHSIEFNASNIPSGVYIYNLTVNGYSVSKKMLYLR